MQEGSRKRSETLLVLIILALLCLIAGGVFIQQFRFNPAVIAQSALNAGSEQVSSVEPTPLVPLHENFTPMTPLERFGPETLYEKINGQADLYLASGFVELNCQRYARSDNEALWFEVFRYDMGSIENAFAVYSQQYRDDGRPFEWAALAYEVANAIFFVHGPYYVEMRASSVSDELVASMQDVAEKFVQDTAVEKETVPGLGWFPKENLDPKSLTMIASNAFGFEQLDQVFTAAYGGGDRALTAFVSERKSPEAAVDLASAFCDYYLKFGGQELETGFPSQDGKTIEIMDSFHIVFSRGPYLAGVHEAMDRAAARELALRLYEKIGVMNSGQSPAD